MQSNVSWSPLIKYNLSHQRNSITIVYIFVMSRATRNRNVRQLYCFEQWHMALWKCKISELKFLTERFALSYLYSTIEFTGYYGHQKSKIAYSFLGTVRYYWCACYSMSIENLCGSNQELKYVKLLMGVIAQYTHSFQLNKLIPKTMPTNFRLNY